MLNHILLCEEIEIIFIYLKWYLSEREIDTQCYQWVRKLKEIFVPHEKESYLITGKFDPMDLYTFACYACMNIEKNDSNTTKFFT